MIRVIKNVLNTLRLKVAMLGEFLGALSNGFSPISETVKARSLLSPVSGNAGYSKNVFIPCVVIMNVTICKLLHDVVHNSIDILVYTMNCVKLAF